MGIFWNTYFVDPKVNERILLCPLNQLIDSGDIQRGYVRTEDLLRLFGKFVSPEMISDQSMLIECTWSSIGGLGNGEHETRRIPVRSEIKKKKMTKADKQCIEEAKLLSK